MIQYYSILVVGGALMVIGLAGYWILFVNHEDAFESLTTKNAVIDLISHLPDAKTGPTFHVVGTVFFVSGLCILTALIASDLLVPTDQLTATVFAVGSILLSIAFSVISMWTLWQARRIDFHAGYKITDFHDLIKAANNEIDQVLDSYRSYHFVAQPFHRFYLVTTQPFFGMISYPASKETAKFKANLNALAEYSKKPSPFATNIICGDKSAVKNMHRLMADRLNLAPEAKEAKIEEYDEEAEQGITTLMAAAGKDVVCRHKKVPPVQFMIVGNKLFEFTLETSGPQSEIYNTQVVVDSRYCTAYVEMFKILKSSNHISLFPDKKPQAAE